MEEKNKKIFLAILYGVIFVVAAIWYLTEPEKNSAKAPQIAATSSSEKISHAQPIIPIPPAAPITPLPNPVTPPPTSAAEKPPVDAGIPLLKEERPISNLALPDIAPRPSSSPASDERQISAAVITSGDEFYAIIHIISSLFRNVF